MGGFGGIQVRLPILSLNPLVYLGQRCDFCITDHGLHQFHDSDLHQVGLDHLLNKERSAFLEVRKGAPNLQG